MRAIAICLMFLFTVPQSGDARTVFYDPLLSDGEGSNSGAKSGSLIKVLRDFGDTGAVAAALPENTLSDPTLQAVKAITLISAGDIQGAVDTLESLPETRDTQWGKIAEAMILRASGELDAARNLIEGVLALDAGNAYAHNVSGTIAATAQEWTTATDSFANAVRLGSQSALYHANLGTSQRAMGDFANASVTLSKALELNPQSCAAAVGRADLFALQSNFAAAERDLEQCLATPKPLPLAAARLVEIKIESGALDDAYASLTRHETLIGQEAPALLAEIALRQGRSDVARAALQKANTLPDETRVLNQAYSLIIEARDAEAKTLMSNVASATPATEALTAGLSVILGNPLGNEIMADDGLMHVFAALDPGQRTASDRAMSLSGAVDVVPGFQANGLPTQTAMATTDPVVRAALARGFLLLARDLYSPAAEAFQVAENHINSAPDASDALALAAYLHASALSLANDNLGAEQALKRSIAAAPEFKSGQFFLGELLAGQGRFEEALPAYRAAHETLPSAATILRVGMAAEAAGSGEIAEAAYRELITFLPNSHIGYNQLAWLLVSNARNLSEARSLAERALEIAPDDPAVKDTLGWTLFQLGDPASALPLLREAHKTGTSASAPLIAYHLANVENAMGNGDRARDLLDELLSYGEMAFVFSQDAQNLRMRLN